MVRTTCKELSVHIRHTGCRVRVVTGTPSLVFHILAIPSVDVDAKNSESKLKYSKTGGENVLALF